MPVPSLFLGSVPLATLAVLSFLTSSTAALAQGGQGAYTYYGCVNEGVSERILYDSHTEYSGMTLGSCASDCAGYTYFGTEYGVECYCGNDFTELPIVFPDSYCWMTCDGDSTEFCGGPMFLSVYSVPVADPGTVSSSSSSSIAAASSSTTISAAQTSSSASPSAAASSSSSAAPSSSSAAASSTTSFSAAPSSSSAAASSTTSSSAAPSSTCVRLGCFTEAGATTPDRTLYDYHYINYGLMSPDICASTCAGYSYFGLEYSGECYCGNEINPASYMVPDSQCEMPCGGDPGEFCGSGNRLDLYSCVGPLSSSSSAAASTSSLAAASSTSATALPFVLAGSPAAPTSTSSSSSSVSTSSSSALAAASTSSSSSSVPTSFSSTLAAASTSSTSSSVATSSSTSLADPPTASGSSSSTSVSSVGSYHHHHHHHPTSSSSSLSTSVSSADPPPTVPTSSSSVGVSSSGTTTSSTSLSSPCPSSTTAVSSPHTLTSTIYSPTTYTITSCAATITDCPARIGKVTTEIVTLYTTYCPEAGKTTPTPTPSPSPPVAPHYTTSTVYTTTVYTITSCAATVTDCPAKIGQVTTQTMALYTTTYPVAGNPLPTPGVIGSPVSVGAPVVTLSITAKLAGSLVTPLPTAKGAAAPIYPANNGTTLGFATAKSTVSGGVAKTTVLVVPVRASASGAERFGGSIFAGVVAAVGALVLL